MEREQLGKYELLERLGQGGMGEVWKAYDTQLRRHVAIKLLHADLQANPDFVAHFMSEARFVASLHHPNIVQIHDFQLTDVEGSRAKAYMVMDYIEGGTLADYIRATIREGRYPPSSDLVDFFAAVSLALDYAHQKGMIHRDIKPANILLDRLARDKTFGEPILTDFGIARLQGAGASTLSRELIGTPLYISPEQAEGRTIDERSDLYSLGIVLYEMLTGVTPFRGDSAIAIMMQHVYGIPTPPASINSRISPALSAVVLQSIATEPKDRFPSATAMCMALVLAFNVPVPASLIRTGSINEQAAYNPLQPSRPPTGITSYPPTLTASPPPPSPAVLTPASAGFYGSPQVERLQSLPPPEQIEQPVRRTHTRPPRRRWLLIAVAACVLLVLAGVSSFTLFPLLSQKHTTPNPTGNVGTISFVSSPNTPHNTFDQLQVDLKNIPPPPANTLYYAWLGNSNGNEQTGFPHWQLHLSNGAIVGSYSINPPHTDLFASSDWFLVTAEPADSTPVIPFPNPVNHIYYALITHTLSASPTFEVKQCPSANAANALSPCS